MPVFDLTASKQRCVNYRKRLLEMSQNVTALHAGGALSVMEIVDCVYNGLMRRDTKNEYIDTFLMSKGHSGIAQYILLEDLGVLTTSDLNLYCKPQGRLGCHPDYGLPGIEASTGSLGHGMGLAVGMAQADKIRRLDKTVYLVVSDGELQEGSTWECMMMGANLELSNLVAIVDHNGSQSFGHTRVTHPKFYPLREKIEAFGWECVEVDGHDSNAIFHAISTRAREKPFMLVANTTKGKGISYMENKPIWHYRSPNKEEFAQALKELSEAAQ